MEMHNLFLIVRCLFLLVFARARVFLHKIDPKGEDGSSNLLDFLRYFSSRLFDFFVSFSKLSGEGKRVAGVPAPGFHSRILFLFPWDPRITTVHMRYRR